MMCFHAVSEMDQSTGCLWNIKIDFGFVELPGTALRNSQAHRLFEAQLRKKQ